MPRYIPRCFNYKGEEVSYEWLKGVYKFDIHEGDDGSGKPHVPNNAAEAWYPVELREDSGHAEVIFSANGGTIRVIEPGNNRIAGYGRVQVVMRSQTHSYFGREGQKGLIGAKVEDPAAPSAYIDGIGICFGCHDVADLPDGQTVANNYMHVNVTFAKVRLQGETPAPAPTPTPPAPKPQDPWGQTLTIRMSTLLDLRNRLDRADELLRDILNGRVA